MLRHLQIRDFAIVDHLELDFEPGFTVFTGETGAGKSILLDALGLVLGDRAAADLVRPGAERAAIVASFELERCPALLAELAGRGLDAGRECIVQRQIGADGRSRAFVNGIATPIGVLAEIGARLTDIHGQHAHQLLVHRSHQRVLLDDFGGYHEELAAVAAAAAGWRQLEEELSAARGDDDDVGATVNRLRDQLEELDGVALAPADIDALEQQHRRAANGARLLEGATEALDGIAESEASVRDRLGRVGRLLGELERVDSRLAGIVRLLGDAGVAVEEAATALRRYVADLDLEPDTLERSERQLALLHELARKHRCAPAALHELRERLRLRLEQLDSLGERLERLTRQRTEAMAGYRAAAEVLHARRQQAARALETAVAAAMAQLGMPGAMFHVDVEAPAQLQPLPEGGDTVEFQVSANPGQPLRPLARVASGGELSRMSLAIQMVVTSDRDVPTLVFDEVDAGIGGRVAEIVGHELRRLGTRRQVLCVTHLAQVASLAHQHFLVEKTASADSTRTTVTALPPEARTNEIARMLGGARVTKQALAHARQMLAS
ncbi:MAG: DNA repair protein RecN [Gammaproteobacteria bacterium]|nr:DNA repair protein RecN [Gammaproteobacteria bacterium]